MPRHFYSLMVYYYNTFDMTLHEPTETIPANRYVYVFLKHEKRGFPIVRICKYTDPVKLTEMSFDNDDIAFAWTFARDFCNESGVLRDSIRRIGLFKSLNTALWRKNN